MSTWVGLRGLSFTEGDGARGVGGVDSQVGDSTEVVVEAANDDGGVTNGDDGVADDSGATSITSPLATDAYPD